MGSDIIRIALKKNRIILIIRGIVRRGKCYWGGHVDNGTKSDLDIEEIDGFHTGTDVEDYLANLSLTAQYRDAGRAIDCDAFKTFEKTNLITRGNGNEGRTIQGSEGV